MELRKRVWRPRWGERELGDKGVENERVET